MEPVRKNSDKKGQENLNAAGKKGIYQSVFYTNIQRTFREKHFKIIKAYKPIGFKIPNRHAEEKRSDGGDNKNDEKNNHGRKKKPCGIHFLFLHNCNPFLFCPDQDGRLCYRRPAPHTYLLLLPVLTVYQSSPNCTACFRQSSS